MAKIIPFRGYFFNKEKFSSFDSLTTQPYDKIDPESQERYYDKSEFNIVRITKGIDHHDDDVNNNKYTRARKTFDDWLEKKIIVRDTEPAIYAYYINYKWIDGTSKTRYGFTALIKVEPYEKGTVQPHELTIEKHKRDRLLLSLATGGITTGHIFFLYNDPKSNITKILNSFTNRSPAIQTKDEFGNIHSIWKITDKIALSKIISLMHSQKIFIADGHHRYETAINYMKILENARIQCDEPETFEYRMATFFNISESESIDIFATHRLIKSDVNISYENFKKKISSYFDVNEYFYTEEDEERVRQDLLEDLRLDGYVVPTFAVIFPDNKPFLLLKIKNIATVENFIKEKHTTEWKRLDVNILHKMLIENILGITTTDVAKSENIDFVRYSNEAIENVKSGKAKIGFLVNPVKISQLTRIFEKGEKMPQKSTDFYPKLLSGLIINRPNLKDFDKACSLFKKCY